MVHHDTDLTCNRSVKVHAYMSPAHEITTVSYKLAFTIHWESPQQDSYDELHLAKERITYGTSTLQRENFQIFLQSPDTHCIVAPI